MKILLSLTLCLVLAQSLPTTKHDKLAGYRLPTRVTPSHYDLKIVTSIEKFDPSNADSFNFDGIVNITLRATETNVNVITLNAYQLNVTDSVLTRVRDGSTIALLDSTPHVTDYQMATFEVLNEVLEVDTDYVLSIRYRATHNAQYNGFYRSYYSENGKRSYHLVTQFESVFARKAFPCFDEPAFKATWTIGVSISKSLTSYHALSNTEQDGEPVTDPDNSDYRIFQFKKTEAPISSYLVAILVSDFKSTEPATFKSDYETQVGDKEFRTWGKSSLVDQGFGRASQTFGPQAMEYFTEKFGIGYALQKLDQTAIAQFSAGAMENWGLCTYRDYLLFVDDEDEDAVRSAATVTAHELAHQWFGDLATLHWWSDLWLNEGFADYFETHATDKLRNNDYGVENWDLPGLFLVQEHQQTAFDDDGYTTADPLTVIVETPGDAENTFTSIAYSKGGSVLRMFNHVVGEDIFFDALHNYLTARQKSVGTPEDLGNGFQKAIDDAGSNAPPLGGATFNEILKTWHTQAGYPVVQVVERQATSVELSQERFLWDETSTGGEEWFIPLSYSTDLIDGYNNTRPLAWLVPGQNLHFEMGVPIDYYIINNKEGGYYRVNYEVGNWQAITRALQGVNSYKQIHVWNRAQLVDDSWSLAESLNEYLDIEVATNLTDYLQHEEDYLPNLAFAYHGFKLMNRLMNDKELYPAFQKYIISIFENNYKKLTFERKPDESSNDERLRSLVITWMCRMEHQDCVDVSKQLFKQDMVQQSSTIRPSIRQQVYCSAIRHGDSEDWQMLWQRYITTNNIGEKRRILSALACSQDKQIIYSYLLKTLNEQSSLEPQERSLVVTSVIKENPVHLQVVLNFLKDNLSPISDSFGTKKTLESFVNDISKIASNPENLQTMEKIKTLIEHSNSELLNKILKYVDQSIVNIRHNIDWLPVKRDSLVKKLLPQGAADEVSPYLLPTVLVPTHYDLKLIMKIEQFDSSDEDSFQFSGIVDITFDVNEDQISQIVLHGKDIVITDSSLRDLSNGQTVSLTNTKPVPDSVYDKIVYQLSSGTLRKSGQYKLRIEYDGRHRDDLAGFYRSWYKDEQGNTRWLATTQFESTDARRAFPSFDEPKFKAIYNFSIAVQDSLVQQGYGALTNTPLAGTPGSDPSLPGYTLFKFELTPVRISSYLVAFVVSDFLSTEPATFTTNSEQKEFRTWGEAKFINNNEGKLSQTFGPEFIEYMTDRVKVGYDYQKVDQIGIPQFSAGAMENWGLCTYRNELLFVDETSSLGSVEQQVASVSVHELAHQWFGDLVTLHWWSDVWLNEGFATFFESFGLEKLTNNDYDVPSWRIAEFFVVDTLQLSAFIVDGRPTSKPMTYEVYDPTSISNGFSSIAYSKGGSVLRMMSHILGEDIYYDGLSRYLNARRGDVGTSEQLTGSWQAAYDASANKPNLGGKTVDEIFANWHLKAGFPVVTVNRNQTNVKLSQVRFLSRDTLPEDTKWYVPITYTTDTQLNFDTATSNWLTPGSDLTINIDKAVSWIIVNNWESGYYRVNYDIDNWQQLTNYLMDKSLFKNIIPVHRAQLIDDSFSLSESTAEDYLPSDVPLNLSEYILHEDDVIPLEAYLYHSIAMKRLMFGTEGYSKLKTYMVTLLENAYKKVGFLPVEGESTNNKQLRNVIIPRMCELGYSDCVTKAKKLFDSFINNKITNISPDMQETVYCTGIRMSGEASWRQLLNIYQKTTSLGEKNIMAKALGCSKDIDVLKMYMGMLVDVDSELAVNDRLAAIQTMVAMNQEYIGFMVDFVERNINNIPKSFGGKKVVGEILVSISKHLFSEDYLEKIKNILQSINQSRVRSSIVLQHVEDEIISNIVTNIKWKQQRQQDVVTWLNKHY